MQLKSRQVADPEAQQNFDQLAALLQPPSARVYNDADLPVAHNTSTYLTFNSQRWATDGMHSTSTNTGRLVCVRRGLHLITASIRWDVAGAETGEASVWIEHSTDGEIATDSRKNAFPPLAANITTQWRMEPGEYVQVGAYQNSGSSNTIVSAASKSPEFSMTWIGY